jgi:hypothetical protein
MLISILPINTPFTEDLSNQIKLFLPNATVELSAPHTETTLCLVDEEVDILPQIMNQYKDLPIVIFSSKQ